MTSVLLYLSSLLVSIAQIPYLDGYVFGMAVITATIAVNALVIHCIYEFGKGTN